MKRAATLAILGCLAASQAVAGVDAFKSVQIDNSSGGAELSGYVTNDILIDFTGQWTGAQARMGPFGAGSIYQHPLGDITPPNPVFVGLNPALAFDTFVAGGSPAPIGPIVQVPIDGSVDLGGSGTRRFDDSEIDIAWNIAGGVTIADKMNFLIMRLTLRNTVNGTALFLASAGGTPLAIQADVQNGTLSFVPEPTSGVLAALALAIGAGFARSERSALRSTRQNSLLGIIGGFQIEGIKS